MQTRSEFLDVLRAVAILLVIGNHMGIKIPITDNNIFLSHWARGGWSGVDLFFVLSGFLISGLLFKEHTRYGSISFKRFFIRRGFKIYPAFYVMMFLTLFLLLRQHTIHLRSLVPWFVYLQDYVHPQTFLAEYWSPTWSLAVEEQFYILLPLLFIFLARCRKPDRDPFKSIPLIFIFVGVSCFGLRVWETMRHPVMFIEQFHLRMDSLFFGVLISYFYHYYPLKFKEFGSRFKYLLLSAGIALFIPAFIFTCKDFRWMLSIGYVLCYLGSGCILTAVVTNSYRSSFFTKTLAVIGFDSYSIYLWHIPWIRVAIPLLGRLLPSGQYFYLFLFVYVFGAVLLGIFMAKIIELPLLRVRDRLFPSRSGGSGI